MMLVGPMKKKMVTTVIMVIIIVSLIFGVLGYFLLSAKQNEINELTKQAEVVERYVFKENLPAGHIIDKDDLVLAVVKAESTPENSYEARTIVNASNKEEIYRLTGVNYKIGEAVNTLELLSGRKLEINVSAKTTLTDEMLVSLDGMPTDDSRLEEFNMINLPSDAAEGDFIDVRVLFPTGEDFTVLVGKKIEKCTNSSIFLKLSEDDILTMGSAIIEAYMYEGTKLYAVKYVDPSNQLYSYSKVDYVAKYKSALTELVKVKEEANLAKALEKMKTENAEAYTALTTEYPETYAEEYAKEHEDEIKVSEKDITLEEIAKYIGLTLYETEEIEKAVKDDDAKLIAKYENKIVTSKKQIARTYPVKTEVLNAIRLNPNILAEVKANFDKTALISAGIAKYEATLYDGFDKDGRPNDEIQKAYEKLYEKVEKEVEMQKEERIRYLNSLASE